MTWMHAGKTNELQKPALLAAALRRLPGTSAPATGLGKAGVGPQMTQIDADEEHR